jgi:hypothetical protein
MILIGFAEKIRNPSWGNYVISITCGQTWYAICK